MGRSCLLKSVIDVSARCGGLGKILFTGAFVDFTDRVELRSYRFDGRFGNFKLT